MTANSRKVLIVDDEPIKRTVLEDQLREAGFDVHTAADPLQAEPMLGKSVFDVVLTDLRMPGEDGLSFLRKLKASRPDQNMIVMTAYGTVETAVEAMKLGAYDYLQKPFSTEELLLKLDRLLRYADLASENQTLREELSRPLVEREIVGQSAAIREVLARIRAVARTDTTVLVEGESGTGKELVAQTIHAVSHRGDGPFVAVSCAALPRDLVESELFGHEAGAFTGATRRRMGRFECAHGGTLFLDDVDDIPLPTQVKLLRVLQEHTFNRIGGEGAIHANVRVIAATKKSLATMVAAGHFREDLYYRLNVVPLRVPPLRERREDVPVLTEYYLKKLAVKLNREVIGMTPQAVKALQSYDWPGNVRELEHVLERMVALAHKDVLDEEDLPGLSASPFEGSVVALAIEGRDSVDLAEVLGSVEEQLIRWALRRAAGNLSQAAAALGIPRSTLQYKLRKLHDLTGDETGEQDQP